MITNAKEDALKRVFGASDTSSSASNNNGLKELTISIIDEIKRLPGNYQCCDCNAKGWYQFKN